MMLKLEYKPYTLDFKFKARTSRGTMDEHSVAFLKIYDSKHPAVCGVGEVAPLPGLSEESFDEINEALLKLQRKIEGHRLPDSILEGLALARHLVPDGLSSLRFGLETALLDLINGGNKLIFSGPFYEGNKMIPINGLIWMSDKRSMEKQIEEKVEAGFRCVKLKIGGINFNEELGLIKYLRSLSDQIMIRLDANGSLLNNEAITKLIKLAEFNIHSIEQPILPRQLEAMQLLCSKSPIPIALDEELVGIWDKSQRVELLRFLKPKYLILKPTIHGGISSCMEWVSIANLMGIEYWFTSALESNIGLNAICQLVDYLEIPGFQGLGTGQLYNNNIASPLEIFKDKICYAPDGKWDNQSL